MRITPVKALNYTSPVSNSLCCAHKYNVLFFKIQSLLSIVCACFVQFFLCCLWRIKSTTILSFFSVRICLFFTSRSLLKVSSSWNARIQVFPSLATSGRTRVILQGASCLTAVTRATPWKVPRCSPAWGAKGGLGTAPFHSVLVSMIVLNLAGDFWSLKFWDSKDFSQLGALFRFALHFYKFVLFCFI